MKLLPQLNSWCSFRGVPVVSKMGNPLVYCSCLITAASIDRDHKKRTVLPLGISALMPSFSPFHAFFLNRSIPIGGSIWVENSDIKRGFLIPNTPAAICSYLPHVSHRLINKFINYHMRVHRFIWNKFIHYHIKLECVITTSILQI